MHACRRHTIRFVIPELTVEELQALRSGEISLDEKTRDYIRSCLSYRFVEAPDSKMALAIETRVKQGGLAAGAPLLNPA